MKIFLKYSKSEVNLWGFASDFFDVLGASWGRGYPAFFASKKAG